MVLKNTLDDIKGLKIIHLNIRSLVPKIDLLRTWVYLHKPKIITLSETFLNNDILDNEISIRNYILYRADRATRHGGVAIYVSTDIASEIVTPIIGPQGFESVFVKIILHRTNKCLHIGSIYRPPSSPVDSFNNLISTITSIPDMNELILLGDFNRNWLDKTCNTIKRKFSGINLTQLIDEPTRVTKKTSSLLDWVLASHPDRIVKSGIMSDCFSDHSIVYCVWKIKLAKSPPKLIKIRQHRKMNTDLFCSDLININWDRFQLIPNVQDAWDYFYTEYNEVLDRHASWRTIKVKGEHLPWITPELISLFRSRDKAWSTYRRTRNNDDWEKYRQLRNQSKVKTRNAKSNYYKECLNSEFRNPKQFWRKIKAITNAKEKHSINQIRINDTILHDSLDVAQALNHHFSSICSTLLPVSYTNDWSGHTSSPIRPASSSSFSFRKITPTEVLNVIRESNGNSGAGLDGLENRYIKLAANVIMYPLADLFNLSLSTNELPYIWKSARITPLHKANDVLDCNNYRPISIICSIAKILEKLVYSQLSEYLKINNILSPSQSGFRSNHSTTTALLKITNDIFTAAGKGEITGAIFVDLTKAFDFVDRYLLLDKLYTIGLSKNAILWFSSFLHNRKQSVVIDGKCADLLVQERGVPQGSALGPLLFSIFVNDLPSIFTYSSVQLYADDTVIYTSNSDIDEVHTTIQSDFNILEEWLLQNKLLLNKNKSVVMIFGSNSKLKSISDSCKISCNDGTILQNVDKVKYLGVWLDSTMTFKTHIDYVVRKVNCRINMLYRSRNCFTYSVRKKLAMQLIFPILDYCDVVYISASKSVLAPLTKVYNRICRFILQCPYLTHHCLMYQSLQFPSPQARRQLHWFQFIFKCIHFNYPPYLKQYFVQLTSNYQTRRSVHPYFSVPHIRNTTGRKAFMFRAPNDWNHLPTCIRSSPSLHCFNHALSSHLETTCSCYH